MNDIKKPKVTNSLAEQELNKAEAQFKAFDDQVKDLTLDRMNEAKKLETEPQTKLSQAELEAAGDIFLKPVKTIGCPDKFNENYRKDWEFKSEYVKFIAENNEIIGEEIDLWTKPFAGVPAMEWKVPVNKGVWGPRYLAEQILNCTYHRLRMDEGKQTQNTSCGIMYGQFVVDNIVERLTARPVTNKKSVFMGAIGF
jgi:hypothetical protein